MCWPAVAVGRRSGWPAPISGHGLTIPGIEPMAQSDTGYQVRCGFLAGLEQQLSQADWYCVTQEFGTLAPLKVIKALRDENLYHHQARCAETSHPVKRNLMQTFSPASKAWRDKILGHGEGVFQQARQLAFKDPSVVDQSCASVPAPSDDTIAEACSG